MADDQPLTDADRADLSRAELLTTVEKLRDVVVALIGLSRNLESRVALLEITTLERINDCPDPAGDAVTPRDPRGRSTPR